ncbi:MAG: hypothetical protein ACFE96_17765 [Candidatus Hermodarchaeota archaeon]
MTLDYVFTRRLSLIKYFYNLALTQSTQPAPQNSISVLMFHDCIELFLILAAEKVGGTISDKMFILDYVNVINQQLVNDKLSQKGTLKRLNDTRKTFKHKGILLGESEIEALRITTKLFLDENTNLIFGINFDEISMIDLIENQNVKQILANSQKYFITNNFKEALEHIAIAYSVLIKEIKISKKLSDLSTFNVLGWRFPFLHRFDMNMSEDMRSINEALGNIKNALEPLLLGVDYRKFIKFKILTPNIVDYLGRYPEDGSSLPEDYSKVFSIHWLRDKGDRDFKKEDVQFCLEFIIETSLKLQEFEFTLED